MVPFKIDLSRKVAAVTGGGGVLCGAFAEALGRMRSEGGRSEPS
jgi:NAD(P)-dependent dehydrogenase (short-subunit alcohol dehydrogenase family)